MPRRRRDRRRTSVPRPAPRRARLRDPPGTLSASTIGGQRSPSLTASTSASACASAASLARAESAADCRSRAAASAGPVGRARLLRVVQGDRAPRPAPFRPPPARRLAASSAAGSTAWAAIRSRSSRSRRTALQPAPALLRLERAAGPRSAPARSPRAAASVARLASASASAHRFGRLGAPLPPPPRRAPRGRHPLRASAASSAASRASAASESRLSCSACVEVLAELAQPPRRVGQRRAGALLLGGDLLLRHAVALQRGARVRLGRRATRGSAAAASVAWAVAWVATSVAAATATPAACSAACAALRTASVTGALDRQQFRLGLADGAGDIAVAAGLPRLPLQRAKLHLELPAQILGARQVGLGGAQLQLRLVAARVQAGDAGRLLQHRAAVLRPGGDQRADPALAHHARGVRAGRQVGEQRLHVARAHLLAVHPVHRCRSRARCGG